MSVICSLPFARLVRRCRTWFAQAALDTIGPSTPNPALCGPCRDILDGRWVTSNVVVDCEPPHNFYQFHGTIRSLLECSAHHGCPLCKVVLAEGRWAALDHNTQMVFSTIREENLMCLEIYPDTTDGASPMCSFTMEKGQY